EPLVDRLLQFLRAMKCAAPDHPVSYQREESLDLIQPRTAGRCEVEMKAVASLRFEPALHFCTFVRAVIVHDQVDFLTLGKLAFQVVQEPNELAATVPLLAGADDFPIENIERGEQSRRAMPFVVVSLSFGQARSQR